MPYTGFIHFFVEQNQGLSMTKITVFKHLFLSIFIYKTLFNLTFLQVKMPVPMSGKWWMSNVSGRKCQNFCCSIVLYEYLGYFRVDETIFFCLTLGQTGTEVLSNPWPLCLSYHFFVILYITCHILFFIQNWMQDYL
jgi:hypothetical protein